MAGKLVLVLLAARLCAQVDPGLELNRLVSEQTGGKFKLRGEFRLRPEARTGAGFGREANLENPVIRTRIGMEYLAAPWLKISALGQDARAPLYGVPAPGTVRDSMDLHESYLELFPNQKRGFGAVIGRQMLNYGESRLIGVPDWSNVARTFDTARFYYRHPRARLEFLFVSPVKVRPDDFNKPVLGDRVWGVYNTFPNAIPRGTLEGYVLRHDQNRPGGFTGAGRLGVNTFGGRAAGALAAGFRYSLEGAAQSGHVGSATHRAAAWFSGLSRTVALHWPVDFSLEYKYASGTDSSRQDRVSTFDQMYPANHDKFGHADLFGWRNIHNVRSLETFRFTKTTALNLMYNNSWLASAGDALYNGAGRAIARAPQGDAGRHVGQEFDVFATQQWGPFKFGAGFAHFFAGEFLRNTTPHVNTRYLYIFQSYTF